jgi:pyruvate, water dikinase
VWSRSWVDVCKLISWFDDVACEDPEAAGGKGASLARLQGAGLPVPYGFVVRTEALVRTLESGELHRRMRALLEDASPDALPSQAKDAQALVMEAPLVSGLDSEVTRAYERLGEGPVAVRSSACAEDSETASFAGQQDTFLNVRGSAAVLAAVRQCWSSFFSERALFYRSRKGSLSDLRIAVVVQRLLAPEKSGVMFTVDPIRKRRDQMVIEAVHGLGESVVSGMVTPDHYIVSLEGELKRFQVGTQTLAIVAAAQGGVHEIALDPVVGGARVLSDRELADLAQMGGRLEDLFGAPQDVEWAFENGRLYLLQSRPVTA